jgi:hypothetical protein
VLEIPIPRGGYRIREATAFGKGYIKLEQRVNPRYLPPLVVAYEVNMNRVVSMNSMLAFVVHSCSATSRLLGNVPFVHGTTPYDAEAHGGKEGLARFEVDLEVMFQERERMPPGASEELPCSTSRTKAVQRPRCDLKDGATRP